MMAATHPAAIFHFESGGSLVYDDVRRFGRLRALDSSGWRRWSRTLGPEPLAPSFTAERLAAALQSDAPIRTRLLDQKRVAGVGNIYAVEALWGARVHPARRSRTLTEVEVAALHRWLRRVLRQAIRARGTTLRDYRTAEGGTGGYGPTLKAYGREGDPCSRCRTPIERLVFGGRSAFLCPRCQPAEEALQ